MTSTIIAPTKKPASLLKEPPLSTIVMSNEVDNCALNIYNAAHLSLVVQNYTPAHTGFVVHDSDCIQPFSNLSRNTSLQSYLKEQEENGSADLKSQSFIVAHPDFYIHPSSLVVVKASNEEINKTFSQFYKIFKNDIDLKLNDTAIYIQDQTVDYVLGWDLTHLGLNNQYLILLSSMTEDGLAANCMAQLKKKKSANFNLLNFLSASSLTLPHSEFTKEEFIKEYTDSKNKKESVLRIADILESLEEKNYALYLERESLSQKLGAVPTSINAPNHRSSTEPPVVQKFKL